MGQIKILKLTFPVFATYLLHTVPVKQILIISFMGDGPKAYIKIYFNLILILD